MFAARVRVQLDDSFLLLIETLYRVDVMTLTPDGLEARKNRTMY